MSAPDAVLGGRGRPARRLRTAGLTAVVVAVCALLLARGITIVPDSEVANTDLAGNPTFEAKSYVESLWASKVLPLVRDKAADAATVLAAVDKDADAAGAQYGHRPKSGDGPWNFVVHGEGTIKTADTQLRHATLTVDVAGHDVLLQIGPVIFGTALRDALPFVSFDQVVNQIQFAQVSRELNDRAAAAARTGLDVAKLVPGGRVSFAGAMSAGSPPQVTVLQLHPLAP
jgi:predicted lipoprotein